MVCLIQTKFFPYFKESHPDVNVHQRAFEKLKPYFVRKLKDRYTCCCITHMQMSFLRDVVLGNLHMVCMGQIVLENVIFVHVLTFAKQAQELLQA